MKQGISGKFQDVGANFDTFVLELLDVCICRWFPGGGAVDNYGTNMCIVHGKTILGTTFTLSSQNWKYVYGLVSGGFYMFLYHVRRVSKMISRCLS